MSNVEYQAEKYVVQLRRPNTATPWGFRLQGGVDFSTPVMPDCYPELDPYPEVDSRKREKGFKQ